MNTIQIRHKIIRSIKEVSDNKLEDLYSYISNLEKKPQIQNNQLKFAGAWKNIDENVFENFTDRIIERRTKSKRRFD